MQINVILYSSAALFGRITGSFLNICILHILNREGLMPDCCRIRSTYVSFRYPLIELMTTLMFLIVFWHFGFCADAFLVCLLGCVLIVLSVVDFRIMKIPDICHILIFLLALLRILLTCVPLASALTGFFIMSVPMLVLTLFTGGFGGGDIKLCAVCGLFLGWQPLLLGTMLGCLAAGLCSAVLICRKKATVKTAIAFGPFLSLGFFLSLFLEPLLYMVPALY